jgi:FAD synthase
MRELELRLFGFDFRPGSLHLRPVDQREGAKRISPARFDADYSYRANRFAGDRWLLVGDDFRFGFKRMGDYAVLEALGTNQLSPKDGEHIGYARMPLLNSRGDSFSSACEEPELKKDESASQEYFILPYEWCGPAFAGSASRTRRRHPSGLSS